ncbi:MAG TPA: OmpA family protein [Aeromonadales bacterium]|nr:OmpA family protein [Aeromonadales bacterium]
MKLLKTLIITASFVSLVSCQTFDPYTGEQKTSNATKYGLGAAIVCGLIGAGESGKHARNAAAGCGAIGAGIGAYMDSQESQLRKTLLNSGVQVKREGDNIRLVMPEKITFDTNRSDLRVSFMDVLDSVILVLRKYPDTVLKVVGHTDSVGSDSYNLDLSERRANSVASYLITKGISPRRIQAYGAGEGFPVATNETELGRSMNRRVELSIAPVRN